MLLMFGFNTVEEVTCSNKEVVVTKTGVEVTYNNKAGEVMEMVEVEICKYMEEVVMEMAVVEIYNNMGEGEISMEVGGLVIVRRWW